MVASPLIYLFWKLSATRHQAIGWNVEEVALMQKYMIWYVKVLHLPWCYGSVGQIYSKQDKHAC